MWARGEDGEGEVKTNGDVKREEEEGLVMTRVWRFPAGRGKENSYLRWIISCVLLSTLTTGRILSILSYAELIGS